MCQIFLRQHPIIFPSRFLHHPHIYPNDPFWHIDAAWGHASIPLFRRLFGLREALVGNVYMGKLSGPEGVL